MRFVFTIRTTVKQYLLKAALSKPVLAHFERDAEVHVRARVDYTR